LSSFVYNGAKNASISAIECHRLAVSGLAAKCRDDGIVGPHNLLGLGEGGIRPLGDLGVDQGDRCEGPRLIPEVKGQVDGEVHEGLRINDEGGPVDGHGCTDCPDLFILGGWDNAELALKTFH
jgi:hypothetical protein